MINDLSHGIPTKDSSVDGVWFKWAMHWLENPAIIIRELARVLKPGALAYIATLSPYDVANNETFLRNQFKRDDLLKRFPESEVTPGYDEITQDYIWIVDHTKLIDEFFATHPTATLHTYHQNLDSRYPRFMTGFMPEYFTHVAHDYGLIVEGLETVRNDNFPNKYSLEDPRSLSKLHVLLKKPL